MLIHFTPMDLSSSCSNLFNNIRLFTEVEKAYENEFDVLGSIQHHIIHNQKWERYKIPITRERILPLIFLILSSVSFYLICVALPLNFFHRRKTINGFGNRRLAISGQCSEDSGGFGEDENDKGEGNRGAGVGNGGAGYSESNNDDNEWKSDDDNDDDSRGKTKQKKRKDCGADYRRISVMKSSQIIKLWQQNQLKHVEDCEISALKHLDEICRKYTSNLEAINRSSRTTRKATGMGKNFSEADKERKKELKKKLNEDRMAVLSDLEKKLNGKDSFVFKIYSSVPGFEQHSNNQDQTQEASEMGQENQSNEQQPHPGQNDQIQRQPGQKDQFPWHPGQNDQFQLQLTQNDQIQWKPGRNDQFQWQPGQNDQFQWQPGQNDQFQWQPGQDNQSQWQPGRNDQFQWQPGQNDQFQWQPGQNDPFQLQPGQNEQFQWQAGQNDPFQLQPGQNEQFQWQDGQNDQFQWQPGQNDQSQWHPCQNNQFQWHPGQNDPWQPHPVQYDQFKWQPGQDSAWQLGENNPYDQQDQFRYQPYSESNNDGNEWQSNDDNDGDCRGKARKRKSKSIRPDNLNTPVRKYRKRVKLQDEKELESASAEEVSAFVKLDMLFRQWQCKMEAINSSSRKARKQTGMLKAFSEEDKKQKEELKQKLKEDQKEVLDNLEIALRGKDSFLFRKYKSLYGFKQQDSLMGKETQNDPSQPPPGQHDPWQNQQGETNPYEYQQGQQSPFTNQPWQEHQWEQQTISDLPVSQVQGCDQPMMHGGSHDDSLAQPQDYIFDIDDYIPTSPTDSGQIPLSAYPPLQKQSLDEFKPYTQEKQQDNSEDEHSNRSPHFWFFPTETGIEPLQPSTSQLAGQQYWVPPSTAQQSTLDNGQSRHHSQETQSQQKQRTHMEGEGQSRGKAIHGDESPFVSSMRISEPVFHLPEQQQQQKQIQLGAYQSQESQLQMELRNSSSSYRTMDQWQYHDNIRQTQNDQAFQSNLFPLMPLHQAEQGQQSMPLQQGVPEEDGVSDTALIEEIIKDMENE